MKKLAAAIAIALASQASPAGAQVFNHLGAGIGVGTTGVSVELSTPVTSFVQMRAGISYMPGITFHADADYTYTIPNVGQQQGTVNLKGDLGRVQGQVIFNVYPIPRAALYVAVGGYFGGNKLLKITGHSDDLGREDVKAVIGDYQIPANSNGDISGGFKIKGFRPYVGIGWGRMIPGSLLNFSTELGVQFEGRPELYTDYGEIDKSITEDDNTFNKIADALKVYPTLTFRLNFKAF